MTGGFVTRSYVSSLRKGKIGSPGFDKLRSIAGAMGFPPELWFDDSLGAAPGPTVAGEEATVAERLKRLFETIVDDGHDKPYTTADVARMSYGGITEEEIDGILAGSIEHPTLDQVLALSEAFGVEPSYFTRRIRSANGIPDSLAQEESTTIVRKTLALSGEDRKVILDLLDHLGRRRETS